MYTSALSALLAITATALAQPEEDPALEVPLYDKIYAYPTRIPYQVDPNAAAIRGPQVGYNICNSTTENQNSMCQTSFFNHIDDFCLWGPPKPNSAIANTEGEVVAWCTKPGHGTRLIPAGALKGIQYIKTPNYIQVAGFIDQSMINMVPGDAGGELDPHGADQRGNPLGGLLYSNAFPSNKGNNETYQQVSDWTNFMGSDTFCFKACDPEGRNQAELCVNSYDRLGCMFNVPNNAQRGTFEACLGDDMTPPGVYTVSGEVHTWYQPAESLGPVVNIPYTPVAPASSSCTTYHSADLYPTLPTPTHVAVSTSAPPKKNSSGTTRSGAARAPASTSSGGSGIGISFIATITSVAFVVAFLS